jgi:hypothetical protein
MRCGTATSRGSRIKQHITKDNKEEEFGGV